jgi:phosphatidylethanolamine-binding protein (PEBP) family uncharacterized protein
MKKLILVTIAVSFLVFSCAGTKISPNAVKLGVNFNLEPKHKCSSISPEITVSNIPSGTKELKVVLVDRDVPTWNHGGGTVAYKGSGVIPEGALKSGYNGPCPPSGSHTYEFKVKAMDAKGVVIGMGSKTQSFP